MSLSGERKKLVPPTSSRPLVSLPVCPSHYLLPVFGAASGSPLVHGPAAKASARAAPRARIHWLLGALVTTGLVRHCQHSFPSPERGWAGRTVGSMGGFTAIPEHKLPFEQRVPVVFFSARRSSRRGMSFLFNASAALHTRRCSKLAIAAGRRREWWHLRARLVRPSSSCPGRAWPRTCRPGRLQASQHQRHTRHCTQTAGHGTPARRCSKLAIAAGRRRAPPILAFLACSILAHSTT